MQLLAACQQSPDLTKLVLKSSAAFYGARNRDPAMFDEGMVAKRLASGGFAKDVAEVESYTRGFARRRPDVAVTTLRIANVIGPKITTAMTGYFGLPVVPTVLGFNPRLQFLHEQRRARRAAARDAARRRRHLQHRRRRRDHARPGPATPRPALAAAPGLRRARRSGRPSGRPGWPTSPRAGRVPDLRARARHHPHAHHARVRAPVHHRRGVRRLRPLDRARPARARPGPRRRVRRPGRPHQGRRARG